MKNIVYITYLYPGGIGRQMYSYGVLQELQEYCNIQAYSSLSCLIPLEEAQMAVPGENIHFYREPESAIQRRKSHFLQRVIFKLVGTFEAVNDEMVNAISDYIRENQVDAVIIDHIAEANYFLILRKRFPKLPILYSSHNAESVNYYQMLTGNTFSVDEPEKLIFPDKKTEWKYRYFERMERNLIRRANKVITICKCDAELLGKIFHAPEKHFLVSHPISRFDPVCTEEDCKEFNFKIMIVGAMNWYPNVRGIQWFVEKVFLPLTQKDSRYQLYLVGKDPEKEIVELGEKYENIVVTGSVLSTEPYFKDCDISAIPVFEGTGAKIKVLESIARGIPTVCSGYAAKDYSVDGEIAVADTAEEFIQAIQNIAESAELRVEYHQKMKAYIQDYYRPTKDMQRFLKIKLK